MTALIPFFKTGSGECTFDCEENGEFVLVLSGINSYIIKEDHLITLSPTPLALAKELVSDIETYKKEWDMWNPDYEELTNVSKMARSAYLKHRTNQLKKSIEYQGVQYHAIPKSYKDPGSAFYEKSEDKTEEKE